MKNPLPLLLLIIISLWAQPLASQSNKSGIALRAKHFNLDNSKTAIQGYDPISYILGKPQKGLQKHSVEYNGITYLFSNVRNMELFKTDPAKFEPAYGGWCAYAMGATGEKVEIDPETYKIINGRLYLFYNAYFNNTLPKWNKDESKLNKSADTNWLKTFN